MTGGRYSGEITRCAIIEAERASNLPGTRHSVAPCGRCEHRFEGKQDCDERFFLLRGDNRPVRVDFARGALDDLLRTVSRTTAGVSSRSTKSRRGHGCAATSPRGAEPGRGLRAVADDSTDS